LINGSIDRAAVVRTDLDRQLDGLVGTHPVIDGGRYQLHFNQFLDRLERFKRATVPAYETYHALKNEFIDAAREEIKLAEFQPRVLTSFVRNKLLDTVYLPLIGDNLAKQMGEAGEQKRTDRMGLLLLISPPGYGKTTLMEYIANRLGIIFMKVNGPAIGHRVTSLDPAEAPNAAARQYLEFEDGKISDSQLRSDLVEYDMQMHAIALTHFRSFEERASGVRSAAPLVMKYLGTEAEKTKSELLLAIMGSRGLGWEGEDFSTEELDTLRLWAMSKAMTIAGGSSEIQLNVIAKSVLALPQAGEK
jgi:hypothetical protein